MRRERKGDRRPISKRLHAALWRSFRGHHGEKNGLSEESARGDWDLRKDQQPFQPNPNEDGDQTTTLRQLLRSAADALLIAYVRVAR